MMRTNTSICIDFYAPLAKKRLFEQHFDLRQDSCMLLHQKAWLCGDVQVLPVAHRAPAVPPA
jgi:hypothetical protein